MKTDWMETYRMETDRLKRKEEKSIRKKEKEETD